MQVLGDMFAAIGAAIYLDSELDVEIAWKVRFAHVIYFYKKNHGISLWFKMTSKH